MDRRIAVYARTAHKESLYDEIESQIRSCKAMLADSENAAAIYTDHAPCSPSEIRCGLQLLLHESDMGNVDMVVTLSLSRLARDSAELLNILRRFRSNGTSVYAVKENFTMSREPLLMEVLMSEY